MALFLVPLLALAVAAAGVFLVVTHEPNRVFPAGIVIHHSALGSLANDRRANAASINAAHARRGFGTEYEGRIYHIGYHYVIRHDGTVEPGRPERCRGAHCRGHNDYLGVCVLGTFNDREPSRAQQQALVRLCRKLMARYAIPTARVVRHRDLARTECPGTRFPFAALRQQLTAASPRLAQRAGP